MKDLKIRVANEAESKEAQELFFKLGYVWTDTKCQTKMKYTVPVIYSSFEDGDLCCDKYDISHNHKEITLQELRDMVNPMKEYLEKQADGSYKLVMRGVAGKDDDIEVPDGAEVFMTGFNTDRGCAFYKDGFNMVHGDNWKWESCRKIDISNHAKTAWQRHTQPEELPFVDDEPKYTDDEVKYMDENGQWRPQSINDQYAEIEQVRQQTDSLPEFKHDFVNHPKHYCDHPSGIECIDAIEAGMSEEMFEGYLKGCCNKYLWRYKMKGGSESLRKAQWYLDRLIKLNEKIESRN